MSCFNFRRNYSGGAADLLAPSQGLSEHHASSTAPTVLPSHPSLSNTSSYYDGYPVVSTMTKPAFIPSRGQMGVPDDFIMSPHPSLHMEHAQSTEFPFPQMAPPQPPVPAPVHMPAVGRPKPCPVQVGEKGQSSSRYPPGLNLRTPSFFKRSSYKSIATPPLTPSTPSPPHSDDLFLPEPEDDAPISHEDQHAPVADDMKCDEPTEQQDVAEDEEVTTSSRMLRNHELHPVFAESYVILAELGTGGFGFVVKGVRVSDGVPVAIKFIIKDNMPEHARVTSPLWNNGRTMLPSEAAMLMRINHPGIVGFVDLFEDKNFFYLVMEHHGSAWSGVDIDPGKQNQAVVSNKSASKSGKPVRPPLCFRRSSCDLFECIEQKKLSEDEARLIFAQMVSVIHYLDANSISHMDIKDENVVIDQNLKVKLIDFGSAVHCDRSKLHKTFFGTAAYASPQALAHKPYSAPASDVWALGILFSILLCSQSIFPNPAAVLDNNPNRSLLKDMSVDSRRILQLCLCQDPSKRITIQQLYEYPSLQPFIARAEELSCQ